MMGGNPARCQYPRGKGRATHSRTVEDEGRPATEAELPCQIKPLRRTLTGVQRAWVSAASNQM